MIRAAIMALAITASGPALAAKCLIVVDDQTKLSGPCQVHNGMINVTVGATPNTYFAVLPYQGGEAFWNEERGINHAHSPLGEVTKSGACWLGRRVRVCAWN